MKCPTCEGDGMDRVQLSDGTNYPDAMTPCSDCDGFGVVSLEEWIVKHGTDVKEGEL